MIFKLPHQDSIDYLKKVAPNMASLSSRLISNLGAEKGHCFIQSDADVSHRDLKKPQRLEIRPKCTQHGGTTQKNQQSAVSSVS